MVAIWTLERVLRCAQSSLQPRARVLVVAHIDNTKPSPTLHSASNNNGQEQETHRQTSEGARCKWLLGLCPTQKGRPQQDGAKRASTPTQAPGGKKTGCRNNATRSWDVATFLFAHVVILNCSSPRFHFKVSIHNISIYMFNTIWKVLLIYFKYCLYI